MRARADAAAVAVMLCVVAGGCGRTVDQSEQTSTAAQSSSRTTPSSSSVVPAAFGYTPMLEAVKGVEGAVTYDVHLPQLAGGMPVVRDRFNDGMRTALRDLIDGLLGPEKTVEVSITDLGPEAESSRVAMIGPHVVAGVQLYRSFAGSAHPTESVATIVINTDTAQPVTYDDLFPQQYAALQRLKQVLPELDSTGRLRSDGIYGPLEQWLPVPTGLRFYVPVSHDAGDFVPVTVPWERIRDLVTPEILPVLSQ
ncbi:hypothetical protein [Mycobacteroides sp. LB1]|uniref:hypothetical protein n=1 Tax=Mycobacteroides sp. LB1 TaxID=2750814 RepID=UPI00352F015F